MLSASEWNAQRKGGEQRRRTIAFGLVIAREGRHDGADGRGVARQRIGVDLDGPKRAVVFYSYECKPLPTNHCSGKEVLEFRDNAWKKYFSNPSFLRKIEKKFGKDSVLNIKKLSEVKLKRKILEN